MATISKYQIASGATLYRVRYRTPDHRQTDKRGFKTKRDAEAFAATVEVSKLKGEYVAPAHARVTLGELGPAWLERQRGHLKPSGYNVMETAWRLRVEPRWGRVAIGDIKPTAVQQWVAEIGRGTETTKPAGASVVKRTHYVLSRILADAVRDNLIARNAAAGASLPRTKRKPPVYLTHEQVGMLAGASGEYEGLVLTLAYTGIRWGEAVGLRVRDLDMLRKRAKISENAVQSAGEIHVGTPKAHKQRTVPLPEFLLPYLATQCEGKARDGLLWPGEDGKHLRRPHPTSGWFAKAVAASRVPRMTPHDLRHTAASLAVSAGANVKAVQKMLGHASAAMTLDVYADLFDDDLEAVATALDAARLRESVGKTWARGGQSAP
ncbi:site-specific integrase [Mycobacteroides abscessus]|uniref:site-specific integrase n=1 Tax=Mycobacteroides abscessus TaxID=36809 RepID=UPI0005DBDC1E|nr:site-specific integrase [Mycobacteroides abscessus]CPX80708.1 Putative integrase [Mycobacteroides abscessus]